MDYEIYQAETGHKKQYIVFASYDWSHVEAAKQYFKCSVGNLLAQYVWVNGEDLYLENPHIKGFRKAYALSYYSNRRKF